MKGKECLSAALFAEFIHPVIEIPGFLKNTVAEPFVDKQFAACYARIQFVWCFIPDGLVIADDNLLEPDMEPKTNS